MWATSPEQSEMQMRYLKQENKRYRRVVTNEKPSFKNKEKVTKHLNTMRFNQRHILKWFMLFPRRFAKHCAFGLWPSKNQFPVKMSTWINLHNIWVCFLVHHDVLWNSGVEYIWYVEEQLVYLLLNRIRTDVQNRVSNMQWEQIHYKKSSKQIKLLDYITMTSVWKWVWTFPKLTFKYVANLLFMVEKCKKPGICEDHPVLDFGLDFLTLFLLSMFLAHVALTQSEIVTFCGLLTYKWIL